MQLLYQGNHKFRFGVSYNLDYEIHLQNSLELIFLQEGTCHFRCGSTDSLLRPGQLLVVFPNQVHSFDSSHQVRSLLLIVPVQPYLAAYADTLFRMVPEQPCLETGSLQALLEMMEADIQTASEPVMQGYLQVLVGKVLERATLKPFSGSPDDALHKLLVYLEEHYTESLSRKQIARVLGYSESYLSHIFSKALGTTMPDYINTLRVRKAMELLRRSDCTVADAATALGFGSVRNFNRAFQKETGMTPAKWRKEPLPSGNADHPNDETPILQTREDIHAMFAE